jgi:predicted nucleic acid-binding protein
MDTLNYSLAISALTYAEVLVHPAKAGRADEFERNISGLGLRLTDISSGAAREISDLRALTSLKMPDVVVLSLARELGGVLATTNSSLAYQARELSLGVLHPTS